MESDKLREEYLSIFEDKKNLEHQILVMSEKLAKLESVESDYHNSQILIESYLDKTKALSEELEHMKRRVKQIGLENIELIGLNNQYIEAIKQFHSESGKNKRRVSNDRSRIKMLERELNKAKRKINDLEKHVNFATEKFVKEQEERVYMEKQYEDYIYEKENELLNVKFENQKILKENFIEKFLEIKETPNKLDFFYNNDSNKIEIFLNNEKIVDFENAKALTDAHQSQENASDTKNANLKHTSLGNGYDCYNYNKHYNYGSNDNSSCAVSKKNCEYNQASRENSSNNSSIMKLLGRKHSMELPETKQIRLLSDVSFINKENPEEDNSSQQSGEDKSFVDNDHAEQSKNFSDLERNEINANATFIVKDEVSFNNQSEPKFPQEGYEKRSLNNSMQSFNEEKNPNINELTNENDMLITAIKNSIEKINQANKNYLITNNFITTPTKLAIANNPDSNKNIKKKNLNSKDAINDSNNKTLYTPPAQFSRSLSSFEYAKFFNSHHPVYSGSSNVCADKSAYSNNKIKTAKKKIRQAKGYDKKNKSESLIFNLNFNQSSSKHRSRKRRIKNSSISKSVLPKKREKNSKSISYGQIKPGQLKGIFSLCNSELKIPYKNYLQKKSHRDHNTNYSSANKKKKSSDSPLVKARRTKRFLTQIKPENLFLNLRNNLSCNKNVEAFTLEHLNLTNDNLNCQENQHFPSFLDNQQIQGTKPTNPDVDHNGRDSERKNSNAENENIDNPLFKSVNSSFLLNDTSFNSKTLKKRSTINTFNLFSNNIFDNFQNNYFNEAESQPNREYDNLNDFDSRKSLNSQASKRNLVEAPLGDKCFFLADIIAEENKNYKTDTNYNENIKPTESPTRVTNSHQGTSQVAFEAVNKAGENRIKNKVTFTQPSLVDQDARKLSESLYQQTLTNSDKQLSIQNNCPVKDLQINKKITNGKKEELKIDLYDNKHNNNKINNFKLTQIQSNSINIDNKGNNNISEINNPNSNNHGVNIIKNISALQQESQSLIFPQANEEYFTFKKSSNKEKEIIIDNINNLSFTETEDEILYNSNNNIKSGTKALEDNSTLIQENQADENNAKKSKASTSSEEKATEKIGAECKASNTRLKNLIFKNIKKSKTLKSSDNSTCLPDEERQWNKKNNTNNINNANYNTKENPENKYKFEKAYYMTNNPNQDELSKNKSDFLSVLNEPEHIIKFSEKETENLYSYNKINCDITPDAPTQKPQVQGKKIIDGEFILQNKSADFKPQETKAEITSQKGFEYIKQHSIKKTCTNEKFNKSSNIEENKVLVKGEEEGEYKQALNNQGIKANEKKPKLDSFKNTTMLNKANDIDNKHNGFESSPNFACVNDLETLHEKYSKEAVHNNTNNNNNFVFSKLNGLDLDKPEHKKKLKRIGIKKNTNSEKNNNKKLRISRKSISNIDPKTLKIEKIKEIVNNNNYKHPPYTSGFPDTAHHQKAYATSQASNCTLTPTEIKSSILINTKKIHIPKINFGLIKESQNENDSNRVNKNMKSEERSSQAANPVELSSKGDSVGNNHHKHIQNKFDLLSSPILGSNRGNIRVNHKQDKKNNNYNSNSDNNQINLQNKNNIFSSIKLAKDFKEKNLEYTSEAYKSNSTNLATDSKNLNIHPDLSARGNKNYYNSPENKAKAQILSFLSNSRQQEEKDKAKEERKPFSNNYTSNANIDLYINNNGSHKIEFEKNFIKNNQPNSPELTEIQNEAIVPDSSYHKPNEQFKSKPRFTSNKLFKKSFDFTNSSTKKILEDIYSLKKINEKDKILSDNELSKQPSLKKPHLTSSSSISPDNRLINYKLTNFISSKEIHQVNENNEEHLISSKPNKKSNSIFENRKNINLLEYQKLQQQPQAQQKGQSPLITSQGLVSRHSLLESAKANDKFLLFQSAKDGFRDKETSRKPSEANAEYSKRFFKTIIPTLRKESTNSRSSKDNNNTQARKSSNNIINFDLNIKKVGKEETSQSHLDEHPGIDTGKRKLLDYNEFHNKFEEMKKTMLKYNTINNIHSNNTNGNDKKTNNDETFRSSLMNIIAHQKDFGQSPRKPAFAFSNIKVDSEINNFSILSAAYKPKISKGLIKELSVDETIKSLENESFVKNPNKVSFSTQKEDRSSINQKIFSFREYESHTKKASRAQEARKSSISHLEKEEEISDSARLSFISENSSCDSDSDTQSQRRKRKKQSKDNTNANAKGHCYNNSNNNNNSGNKDKDMEYNVDEEEFEDENQSFHNRKRGHTYTDNKNIIFNQNENYNFDLSHKER